MDYAAQLQVPFYYYAKATIIVASHQKPKLGVAGGLIPDCFISRAQFLLFGVRFVHVAPAEFGYGTWESNDVSQWIIIHFC